MGANNEVYYVSPNGTEWTPDRSRHAIDDFTNIGKVLAGMWTVEQYNEWLSDHSQRVASEPDPKHYSEENMQAELEFFSDEGVHGADLEEYTRHMGHVINRAVEIGESNE